MLVVHTLGEWQRDSFVQMLIVMMIEVDRPTRMAWGVMANEVFLKLNVVSQGMLGLDQMMM